jgi:hypothetical protein
LSGIGKNECVFDWDERAQAQNGRFKKSLLIQQAKKVLGRALAAHGPESFSAAASHYESERLIFIHVLIMSIAPNGVKRVFFLVSEKSIKERLILTGEFLPRNS